MDYMPVYNILSESKYCFIQGYDQTIFFMCYISPNHSKNLVTLRRCNSDCSETFMLAFIVTPKYFPSRFYLE